MREASGRLIGALAGRFRDLDLAEDAFGEACAKAAEVWPEYGAPSDPIGWLYRAAERKALDALRAKRSREKLAARVSEEAPINAESPIDDESIPDERLRLIFICCHPALPVESRIALTLRLVCGLTVNEIARAFAVPGTTLAQRLVRAKSKIADAGVPLEIPGPQEWHERLEAVLSTLEIAYDKSYEDAAGEGPHAGYAEEVIALTSMLAQLVPDSEGANALAALVRYSEARRPARCDDAGAMVPVSEQDPFKWNRVLIDQADVYLKRSWSSSFPCFRAVQAAIHGTWCWRESLREPPPWRQVAALYDLLLERSDDAFVRLNRAVAVAETQGVQMALMEVESLNPGMLKDCLSYHAVRADFLSRLNRVDEALSAYDAAIALIPGSAERIWLQRMRSRVAQRA